MSGSFVISLKAKPEVEPRGSGCLISSTTRGIPSMLTSLTTSKEIPKWWDWVSDSMTTKFYSTMRESSMMKSSIHTNTTLKWWNFSSPAMTSTNRSIITSPCTQSRSSCVTFLRLRTAFFVTLRKSSLTPNNIPTWQTIFFMTFRFPQILVSPKLRNWSKSWRGVTFIHMLAKLYSILTPRTFYRPPRAKNYWRKSPKKILWIVLRKTQVD